MWVAQKLENVAHSQLLRGKLNALFWISWDSSGFFFLRLHQILISKHNLMFALCCMFLTLCAYSRVLSYLPLFVHLFASTSINGLPLLAGNSELNKQLSSSPSPQNSSSTLLCSLYNSGQQHMNLGYIALAILNNLDSYCIKLEDDVLGLIPEFRKSSVTMTL